MTEVQPPADKSKSHSKYDNCENCIRERKQNESFIQIYQRLQEVDSKTQKMKQAIRNHKISSDTNRSFYHSFEEKIISLPKIKKESNSIALENVGFALAASILEKDNKRSVVEENNRLKKTINEMYICIDERRNKRWQEQDSLELMKSSYFTQKNPSEQDKTPLDRTFNSCQTGIPRQELIQTKNLQNLLVSGQSSFDNYRQNTTVSSSFNTPIRQSLDLSKYNDLNLWLYQNQSNTALQKQLYEPNKSKNKSMINRRIPLIRSKK